MPTMAAEPPQPAPTGWFWPEADAVRWWTPHATGLLPAEPCATAALAADDDILSDPDRLWLLTTTLTPALARLLSQWLDEQPPRPWRLALSADLPPAWQRLPFECLTHRGQGLDTRIQIIRHTPRTADPPTLPRTPEIVIVDVWPEAERVTPTRRRLFTGLLEGVTSGRVLRGVDRINAQWPWLDLSMAAVLCVIGHGSEGGDPQPFRIGPEQYWTPPLTQGLPPVVILVGCSDEQGNLLDYGQSLLAAGAQTVLAPLGRLDAAAADEFLRAFLRGWEAGHTVSEILWTVRQQPGSNCGAGRMRLLGRGDVHRGPVRQVSEYHDTRLVETAALDDAALTALLERITWRCFQSAGSLDSATDELYDALSLHYDDSDAEEPLLARLDGVWAALSLLTAHWVTPYLVYLAEVYDHRRLSRYEALRLELEAEAAGLPPLPIFHYYWGKLYYRQGRYGKMLEELACGFRLLDENRLSKAAGVGLLGLLVNGLIDLNLPEPGLRLYDRLDGCLSYASDRLSLLQKTNRLDRRARLALRQGDPQQALMHYQLKRSIDIRDPDREQASLLYAAAWADPHGAGRHRATAVAATLKASAPVLPALGPGSETLAYLLRAYALWIWRAQDQAGFIWLAEQLATVTDYFSGRDPGPLGFALGYLHVYQQAVGDSAAALPAWDAAVAALEEAGYWLELAIFSALLEQPTEAERFLQRFHALRRYEVLPTLAQLPAWLTPDKAICWVDAVSKREQQEQDLLLETVAVPDITALVAAGVLPL